MPTPRPLVTSSLLLGLVCVPMLLPPVGGARPERVRPGVSYYSDDYVEEGGVGDLAAEKNFEEVYQFYRYYEASYDGAGRVTLFKEFVRGELVRSEHYRYGEAGELVEKRVHRPGAEDEITRPATRPSAEP
ncbi:MAG: hypothetical protein JRH19_12715 [Deltaproteobacteria bacterium]|nr:hypothetical protein [Deltaproteobacteria bacterium]